MPLYLYKCPTCNRKREVLKRLADIDSPTQCMKCSDWMNRQLTAAHVAADYPPYNCPITGKLIEGRAAHRENLARHGCRVLETGEKEAAAAFRAREDAELDAKLDETAEKLIESLPQEKLERLHAEADAGVDIQLTRTTANG